jgi:hypothetical protein
MPPPDGILVFVVALMALNYRLNKISLSSVRVIAERSGALTVEHYEDQVILGGTEWSIGFCTAKYK